MHSIVNIRQALKLIASEVGFGEAKEGVKCLGGIPETKKSYD